MQHFGPTPLFLAVPFLLFSPSGQAAESRSSYLEQCIAAPSWVEQLPDLSELSFQDEGSLAVTANDIDVLRNNYARFEGDVELLYNQQMILTDAASYNQQSGVLNASGGMIYQDPYVAVRGDSIEARTQDNSATIETIDYYLMGTAARGNANRLYVRQHDDVRRLDFDGASFTTCPGDRPAWEVRANNIHMNDDEGWGTASGAQVRIFDVPVLYVPRFSFPITDERKSGILYPTVRSSGRNGLELEVPYYFNLAPNYDATLTPRFMSQRGIMGMAEGRYLDQRQQGQINLEYLHQDDQRSVDNSRSYWRIEHESHINRRWSTYVDASAVSDMNYFNDFGSDFVNRADAHLYRRGQADYHHRNWHGQVQVEDFQLLGPYQSPYRTAPRLSLRHDRAISGQQGLHTHWFSEFTHFERQNGSPEQATRLHSEPGLSYRVRQPGWEWTAEGRMLVTHYEQDQLENDSLVSRSITRALPEFRWHAQLNFERPFTVQGEQGLQTLQPQIQYLYTPYRDQRDIGVYDSVPLQEDYHGLFRQRRFSGLDRIADANQVTVGATTGIFDHNADELARLSVGQIFYFADSETQLFDDSTQVSDTTSELAAELDFRLSSRWFYSMSVQYDNQLNQMQKSRSAVEYRKDESNLVQLNFRQVRGLIGTEADVEQVGALGTWQLSPRWAVAGHWYRDLRNNATLDANFGVQYESCCWALRLSAYRRIDRNFEGVQPNQALTPANFDNGVSLQFVITGLTGDRSNLASMLQQGIFGYRRPFYLSN